MHLLAAGQRTDAAALCLKLDKLERDRFEALLFALQRETVSALREGRGLAPDKAQAFMRLLSQLTTYNKQNVGVGHMAGALAVFAANV